MRRVLFAILGLLLLGDAIALGTIDGSDEPPSTWDPRVADLARFVEDARRLRFDHPVAVRFLTSEAYDEETTADPDSLSEDEKEEIQNVEGELRALGLIKKGVSLFDDTNSLTSGGTAAFYDPDAEEIVIRGTELTIGLKVTVVHELTHALQDQHFDLGREFESDNRATLFHGLGEGDATRIENLFIDDLSDREADDYFDEQDAQSEAAEEQIQDVSPALTQLFGAPYALGEPLTSLVVDTRGIDDLNRLFRRPPATDEVLMDPFAALDESEPVKVPRPKARDGEKVTDGGDFGVITWYLMLASFIDEKTALKATDGWGGDAFLGYRKSDRGCVRAAFVGDTDLDNNEMQSALDQWKAAFNSDRVTVTRTATGVELDSCEPDNPPAPRESSAESLILPIIRYEVTREVLAEGGSRKLAQCAVREYFSRFTVDQLTPETEAEEERLYSIGPTIGRVCSQRGEA